jgi:epoxyqueuosine reductase QueG
MQELQEELKVLSKEIGVDLFGVADLTDTQTYLSRVGGNVISNYPRAISIGVRYLNSLVDGLHRHEDPVAIYSYRGLGPPIAAIREKASYMIAKKIEDSGFKAYIPSGTTINPRRLEAALSHKLVANLAGLGWIGKNCLLITKEYGPRLELNTILTDAPLQAGTPVLNNCGECTECVDICPPRALTGVPFNQSEPRSTRYRVSLCTDYTRKRAKQFGQGTCSLCLSVCPYGKND